MLEDRVLYYYKEDYNCAQCMLMEQEMNMVCQ